MKRLKSNPFVLLPFCEGARCQFSLLKHLFIEKILVNFFLCMCIGWKLFLKSEKPVTTRCGPAEVPRFELWFELYLKIQTGYMWKHPKTQIFQSSLKLLTFSEEPQKLVKVFFFSLKGPWKYKDCRTAKTYAAEALLSFNLPPKWWRDAVNWIFL